MPEKKYQRVCITGGSSGMGLAIAAHYAALGSDVAIIARNREKLKCAVDECRAVSVRPNQRIESYAVDVGDTDALPAILHEMLSEFGTPDLLLLSAGVASGNTFAGLASEDFDRVMKVNFFGSKEVIKGVLPAMLTQGYGQIGIVSSMAGLIGVYGYSAYCASKHAVTGLASVLRQELSNQGIGVTLICPGEVDTPMVAAEAATILPQCRMLKDLTGTLTVPQAIQPIVSGLARNRALVIPGLRPRLAYLAFRWCPGMFAWITQRLLDAIERKSHNRKAAKG